MLRYTRLPLIQRGDQIFLGRPSPIGTFEKEGKPFTDYGAGDYRVLQVLPSFVGANPFRNPTTVIIRAETR